jgi:hypothetical protein
MDGFLFIISGHGRASPRLGPGAAAPATHRQTPHLGASPSALRHPIPCFCRAGQSPPWLLPLCRPSRALGKATALGHRGASAPPRHTTGR